jgi:sugar transferase (PEP-CTERM system associated)
MPIESLLNLKLEGVEIEEGVAFYEKAFGKLPIEVLNPSYLVFSSGFKVSKAVRVYKRIFSIVFSIIGMILSAPLMLLTAIAIKIDSRGPILFSQERVGKNGKAFKLLKFRSMSTDAEAGTGPVWAQQNDPRITRVGKFIRRTRIDELPQFINVLKGDMHFVGPRPERPFFVEQLRKAIPYYWQRHSVEPGLTGWAQVRYPYGSTIEEACEKLKYDLYYIKNLSILLDLWIIFQTVKIVLLGRGAR